MTASPLRNAPDEPEGPPENIWPAGEHLRPPPQNLEVERALLGAMLMNNKAYEKVSDFLRKEHFVEPANGEIYGFMADLISAGRPANVVSLKNAIEGNAYVKAAGGLKYLAALAASAVTVIGAADYGRRLVDLAVRRDIIEKARALVEDAYDAQHDISAAELLERGQTDLAGLAIQETDKTVVSFQDAAYDVIGHWEKRHLDGEGGVSYGMPSLDRRAGRMEGGDLIILGARPSMGKTALARTIAFHVARSSLAGAAAAGKPAQRVLFFSAEMKRRKQMGAYLTAFTGIRPGHLPVAMSSDKVSTLVAAAGDYSQLPLVIDDTPAVTLAHMRQKARFMQRQPGGLGLVIVDYLQLMGIERGLRFRDNVERVTYLSAGLKSLAVSLDVPLIALSQLSRAVETRENKRPMLSDLRDSGTIEQDADVIWLLYREQYYLERENPVQRANEGDDAFSKRIGRHHALLEKHEGKAEVIGAKVRVGEVGSVELDWDGPRMWFVDPKEDDKAAAVMRPSSEFQF